MRGCPHHRGRKGSRTTRLLLIGLGVAVFGCSRLPDPELAERAARAHAGEPVTKGFSVGDDEELAELARIGLLEFRPGDDANLSRIRPRRITLSPEGTALGLKIDIVGPDWPWGPTGVSAEDLCEEGFGAVTSIEPVEGGPARAVTVRYTRRNTKQSTLYERLGSPGLAPWCDPEAVMDRSLVMVKRDTGWVPNGIPVVRGEASSLTEFEYDERGILVGAVTSLRLGNIAASDPDGDSLTVDGWSAGEMWPVEEGEKVVKMEERAVPVELVGDTVRFKHSVFMGQPSGGVVRYVVRDPWDAGQFRFCIEGYLFRC